jgi:hypothetical protein
MSKLFVVNKVLELLGLPTITTLLGNQADTTALTISAVDELHTLTQNSSSHWANVKFQEFQKNLLTGYFPVPPFIQTIMTERFTIIDGTLSFNSLPNMDITAFTWSLPNVHSLGRGFSPLETQDKMTLLVQVVQDIDKENLTYQYMLAYQAAFNLSGMYFDATEKQLMMLKVMKDEWSRKYHRDQHSYKEISLGKMANYQLNGGAIRRWQSY